MANRSRATKQLNVPNQGAGSIHHSDAPPDPTVPEGAQRAAQSDCTILITGETGVGKGRLARWIHDHSSRAAGPFIPVNCGAIPESLIDSQLFGHARGAFSGATNEHLGLVRAAEGGTLLLDEVSELPPSAQTRLLRLLQEREVQPIGYSRPVTVDVRILAASNIDLENAVARKAFREDLLFRLDVIRLHVKPLRERSELIPDLLNRFNAEFAKLYRRPVLDFDPAVLHALLAYHWPGNIRQLRALVERLVVLCPDQRITIGHLLEYGQLSPQPSVADGLAKIGQLKLAEVHRALAANSGSIARAAQMLGVHRSTIYRWLRNT